MGKEQVKSAIDALMGLFFSEEYKNEFVALKTLEYYISDLKLLRNTKIVAEEIEKQRAFALLEPMKLLDARAAEAIEKHLCGAN
ncbi:MAG TPA: hypothetical protein VEY51_08070 [Chondromyces sp.]|nr:hypothetical protein [Chondromyces sp.]